MALAILLSASACTGDVPGTYEQIVLTDQCGREVTLDAPAEKVVSCYYVSSYAMLALGLEDKLVGIENKADTRPIYELSAPDVINLPAVGTMKESNTELIASLEPDLVIMPEKLSEAAETLTALGLDVVLVNPENHEELCEMIYLIAQACGVTSKAHELTAYYETQMEVLDIHTANTEKPSVYMGGNSSYLTCAPADMYQSSLIDLAGGVNAAADLKGDYWTEVSYETILAYDPDVIVIPSGADYSVDDLCGDAQLSALTAVKNGAVYKMPGAIEEWDSPVPSGILGAMWLASVLHPAEYTPEDFLNEAEIFYETFYGFKPAEELLH
ncbi:MAG: ABC transporter substrate-binding protein [Clostridia bacterium]|nr:ABC transporter substrate-binding protein [Clostridia bacterium]